MKSPETQRMTWKIVLTIGVTIAGLSLACRNGSVWGARTFPKSSELRRVTSPNGLFDAVLVEDPYGPPAGGGIDYNVYIVRKGAPVHAGWRSEILSADPMTHGELVWRRDHLLEIHFDIAHIKNLRNLWGLYEIENVGSLGRRDFEVEIQLMPASDSSVLTPDGEFRPR